MKPQPFTIGKYLYRRLEQLGLGHIFGVPGDFIFDLLHLLPETNIQYIGTCNELNAGYAADAYARFKGIGGILVTYAVGGLSAVNAVAGAFAEKVPVVVISGGPELSSYKNQPQKHHTIGNYHIPLEIFKKITIASACILDPETAGTTIDKLLEACIQYKQPIYLEIPCDLVHYPCEPPKKLVFSNSPPSNKQDMSDTVTMALELLNKSSQPVFIIGNEVERFKLQDLMKELIYQSGLPFSTFVTDKTTITEQHPQFIGLCGPGINMNKVTREYIENSDCLFCLGSIMASHLKSFLGNLNQDNLITAFEHKVSIRGNSYQVSMADLIKELNNYFKKSIKRFPSYSKVENNRAHLSEQTTSIHYAAHKKITNDKLFEGIASLLKKDEIIIVDSGSSLFTARKIFMPHDTVFLSQPYYASLGYSLPAALGASIANPGRKIILVIGDGAFQFTCQELSTLIRQGLNSTIFLINNEGYAIERALYKDANYNDIQSWKYHQLPSMFGGSYGYEVKTEEDLEKAIKFSESNTGVSMIEVHLDKLDYSRDLETMLEP